MGRLVRSVCIRVDPWLLLFLLVRVRSRSGRVAQRLEHSPYTPGVTGSKPCPPHFPSAHPMPGPAPANVATPAAPPPWGAPKTRGGWAERFGKTDAAPAREPRRPRLLIHTVSVGETAAIRELVPL